MVTERQQDMRRRRARNRRLAAKSVFPAIHWNGYEHHDLYNMIHMAKPQHMHDLAGQWRMLGKAIGDTTRDVQDTLQKLSGTWHGSASDGARASNNKITQWAQELAAKTDEIGDGLHRYADGVSAAQRRMPPPEFAWAERASMLGNPPSVSGPANAQLIAKLTDDMKPNYDKHHAAYQEAIRVMQNYGTQSQAVHDEMPPLPPGPQHVPLPGPDPIDRPGPDSSLKPPDTPPDTPPPDSPDGPNDTPGDEEAGRTTVAAVDPSRGPGPGGQLGTGPGPGTGYGPDASRVGQGTGFGAGAGFPPAGGPGARGAGGGQGARPGAGPLAARGGTGGAHGAAGLGGARGAGGAGAAGGIYPPFGGGAGAQGEEDAEHKNKYDKGLDLFDDIPPAYPPVFGA